MLSKKIKRHTESHEQQDRWVISYADFITLLFAFFVVMYSISSVNEGKYRVLSHSLEQVFHKPTEKEQEVKLLDADFLKKTDELAKIYLELSQELQAWMIDNKVSITATEFWIEINMKSNLLFPSGVAKVNDSAYAVIEAIAGILKGYPNPIVVAGFTDDVPIATPMYPSNWELSSARASAIVRLLIDFGLESSLLSAVGYAQVKPISDNRTEEGRQKNRRVVIRITKPSDHQSGQNKKSVEG
jgi:chemotaxis protein MotB